MRLTQTSTPAPETPSISSRATPATPWLVTVKNAAELFKEADETESAIRANIFKADDRLNSRGERIAGNGLADHCAVIRRGRKVLIDVHRYGNWLAGRDPAEAYPGAAITHAQPMLGTMAQTSLRAMGTPVKHCLAQQAVDGAARATDAETGKRMTARAKKASNVAQAKRVTTAGS